MGKECLFGAELNQAASTLLFWSWSDLLGVKRRKQLIPCAQPFDYPRLLGCEGTWLQTPEHRVECKLVRCVRFFGNRQTEPKLSISTGIQICFSLALRCNMHDRIRFVTGMQEKSPNSKSPKSEMGLLVGCVQNNLHDEEKHQKPCRKSSF